MRSMHDMKSWRLRSKIVLQTILGQRRPIAHTHATFHCTQYSVAHDQLLAHGCRRWVSIVGAQSPKASGSGEVWGRPGQGPREAPRGPAKVRARARPRGTPGPANPGSNFCTFAWFSYESANTRGSRSGRQKCTIHPPVALRRPVFWEVVFLTH